MQRGGPGGSLLNNKFVVFEKIYRRRAKSDLIEWWVGLHVDLWRWLLAKQPVRFEHDKLEVFFCSSKIVGRARRREW